jgi:hypothetical protein
MLGMQSELQDCYGCSKNIQYTLILFKCPSILLTRQDHIRQQPSWLWYCVVLWWFHPQDYSVTSWIPQSVPSLPWKSQISHHWFGFKSNTDLLMLFRQGFDGVNIQNIGSVLGQMLHPAHYLVLVPCPTSFYCPSWLPLLPSTFTCKYVSKHQHILVLSLAWNSTWIERAVQKSPTAVLTSLTLFCCRLEIQVWWPIAGVCVRFSFNIQPDSLSVLYNVFVSYCFYYHYSLYQISNL